MAPFEKCARPAELGKLSREEAGDRGMEPLSRFDELEDALFSS